MVLCATIEFEAPGDAERCRECGSKKAGNGFEKGGRLSSRSDVGSWMHEVQEERNVQGRRRRRYRSY